MPLHGAAIFLKVTSYRELLSQVKSEIDEVDASQARALLDSPAPPLFVDVRERDEWEEGHLPGAIHIPRGSLESRIEQLAIVDQWWNLSQGTPTTRPIDRRAHQLALQASGWNIDMNGAVMANELGADDRYPWNVTFWMGGFDGDALCAYVKGVWTIPLR